MKQITIVSFNVKTPYANNFFWHDNKESMLLANFIKNNNIDFLCTQELVKEYSYKLQKELGKNYTITGNYRFDKIPLINKINESNSIITNKPILCTETKYLSTIPIIDHLTLFPRILTSIQTKEHFIINTHLEFWNKYSQKYQLQILYNYIKNNIKNNPIIVGDFNMDKNSKHFLDFINDLEKLGINHINNNIPTYIPKEQILDHIFISSNYELKSIEITKNKPINQISDHRPIIIKVKKKL